MNMKMSVMAVSAALLVVPAQGFEQLVSVAEKHPVMAGLAAATVLGAGVGARALGSQPGAQQAAAVGLHAQGKATSEGAGKSTKAKQSKEQQAKSEAEHKHAAAAEQVSPRTEGRRLISQLDMGVFKAEQGDITALEDLMQRTQRTVSVLRDKVKEDNIRKELGLSAQEAERRAKEAAAHRTHLERMAATERDQALADQKREEAAKERARLDRETAALEKAALERLTGLFQRMLDRAAASAAPSAVAPLALSVAPTVAAVSPAAQSGTPSATTTSTTSSVVSAMVAAIEKPKDGERKE